MAGTCSVIMPIRKEGTQEYDDYRALYDEVLKPHLVSLGYDVVRADEVQKSGAITREIVTRLASSDLVVADLTDLNPNVFYELGVRHALRGQGTILMLNEERTPTIPFDLEAYRVIRFREDLRSLGKLRRDLASFIETPEGGTTDTRDNPVHDWLPALPMNALEYVKGTAEAGLREKLAASEQRLREYEDIYGKLRTGREVEGPSPLQVITSALEEAAEGNLPWDLLRQAEAASTRHDRKEFLSVVRRVIEKSTFLLPPRDYIQLAGYSYTLGFKAETAAIYQHAVRLYPKDRELRRQQLANFAHSDDPEARERAREQLLAEIGITASNGGVSMPSKLDPDVASLLGIMLDAYHKDDLGEEALSITEVAAARFPTMTIVARNHGRALENVGKDAEALQWYQRALWCPDADDTSAIWLGNELHNRRRFADAIEAYLCACRMDPDDAACFSHVADDLAWHLQDRMKGGQCPRELPENLPVDAIEIFIQAACSCRFLRQEDLERCLRAAKRAEIDVDNVAALVPDANGPDEPDPQIQKRLTYRERATLATTVYELFRSDVTSPPKVH